MYAIVVAFFGVVKVYWKVALLRVLFTSGLFLFGKTGIDLYINNSHLNSTFGSTSVIALLMIWVYDIPQINFLVASFVKMYSDHLGIEINLIPTLWKLKK